MPDAVGLIRSVIRTVARADQLDADLVEDICSAISEACNNAVLHAYPEQAPGPLIFSLAVSGDRIEAVVRDQGCGIRPDNARNRGLGMGITLINSLADRAEFESSPLGTEVRMRFGRVPQASGRFRELKLGAWALTDPGSSSALRARSN